MAASYDIFYRSRSTDAMWEFELHPCFRHINHNNEEAVIKKLSLTRCLSTTNDAEANVYKRTTLSMKRKRSVISGQEDFNQVRRKLILSWDSYFRTCVDSNSSAERLANLNSAFVTKAKYFCVESIKSHESCEQHLESSSPFKFSCTGGLSSWTSNLLNSKPNT